MTAQNMSIRDQKRAQGEATGAYGPVRARSSDETPDVIVSDGFNDTPMALPATAELGAEEEVPPAYSEQHDQLSLHQTGFDAGASVTSDGRVDININQTSRDIADIIAPTLRNQLRHDARIAAESPLPPAYIPPSLGGQPGQSPPPKLNVVIQIVGSRGDVQPFVALGLVLKNTYGHRVRIATHSTFKTFVEENGLEFFSIGGDPAELMAFMVKNPGLMPGFDAVKSGEITKRRKGIEEIVWGCWRSCIEAGDGSGPAPRPQRAREVSSDGSTSMVIDEAHHPFVADAIIANPPSFAHIHCAEKLGVPLHLMFTMPWSPTRAFPQPLANIQSSNTDPVTTNYVSYALVEMMTWQGLGDVINRFRTKVLDLEPLSLLWAPGILTRLRIPYTYCWSPALIPKPNDWGTHIDIAGFYFLNLASNFTPEPDLAAFLAAGPPPVYIGFGSIVVDDPNGLTRTIFDAVAATGVRALVSKGWGGLGADSLGIPEGVFMLGNVPHDWLFNHVSAVCHHGGAGTTAAGINAGKPTIVVPFFGDQPFWGAMVARAGAGPEPIPYKKLDAENLAEAIRFAVKPETQERAQELGAKIREEKGSDVGAQSFHQHLAVDTLRCSVAPSRVAVWRVRRSQTRLSALAASALVNSGYLQYSDLKLFRGKEYSTGDEPWDPISAVTSALLGDIGSISMAIADFPRDIFKAMPKSKSQVSVDKTGKEGPSKDTEGPGTPGAGPADSTASLVTTDTASTSSNQQSLAAPNRSTSGLASSESPTSPRRAPSEATSAQKQKQPAAPPANLNENLDMVVGAGKSMNNIVATGMKTPMNFCMGLARGFRNAPKLYNDDTVRPTEKVTSLSSGLKVAGKEFGLGFYDGITGLITQPMKGAEKEGAVGLIKGFGKGIAGITLKPAAGIWAIPAYAMAGVHAEIRTMFAQSAQNYIVASRISQGNADFKSSSAEEREDIEVRWLSSKDQMKGFYNLKKKEKGKFADPTRSATGQAASAEAGNSDEPPKTGWLNTKNLSYDERKKRQDEMKAWKKRQAESGPKSFFNEDVASPSRTDSAHERDEEFEEAIDAAVRETSRGDPVEDARIEQAIRSSIQAFKRRNTSTSSFGTSASSQSLGPSTQATSTRSYPVDAKGGVPSTLDGRDLEDITDEEYQALIEQAVQMSMAEEHHGGIRMHDHEEEDDDGDDLEQALERSKSEHTPLAGDDEQYRKAIEASQAEHANRGPGHDGTEDEEALRKAIEASHSTARPVPSRPDADEEELKRAIAESERAHQEELARVSSLRNEEDIVMEYVKKQSLAEEEFRKKQGKKPENDDDEDLRRALEESLKAGGGRLPPGGGESSGT